MKIFTGIDLVEINRIKSSMRNQRFLKKICGDLEIQELSLRKNSIQSIAANFAAKEAFLKACGEGLGKFNMRDIQILRMQNGRPYVHLTGEVKKKTFGWDFTLSLTHTKEYAAAVVILQIIE